MASNKTIELVPGAHRSGWSLGITHGTADDRSRTVSRLYERVVRRDDYTCRGCTLRSLKFQEIHPLDEDHGHTDEADFVTLCPLCHQCFHLATAATSGGGSLIWLPEMSQASLNRLAVALFVAMRNRSGKWFQLASSINATLLGRTHTYRSMLGTLDPSVLAQVLVKMSPEEYANRGALLGHTRLLPHPERFAPMIDYWARHVFSSWRDEDWEQALPETAATSSPASPPSAA